MDLIEESAIVDSSGLALLESRLVYLRGYHMCAGGVDLLKDGFLHDL